MRLNEGIRDSTIEKSLKNKDYEKNIKRTFQYTRWFLTVLGVWSMITRDSSRKSKYTSLFVIFTCLVAIAFTFVPTTFHMIFREKNLAVRIVLLGPVSASLGAILKYAVIVLRANTIKMCVEKMKNDWKNVENVDDHAIMTKSVTTGREITIVCAVFLYTGGVSYHTMVPIFKGTTINKFNETIRPLGYPGYDAFVKAHISPTYEIIFCLICVSAFVRYTVTIGISSLAAIFVTHARGQIQILLLRLETFFEEHDGHLDKAQLKERMTIVIRSHVSGLRMSAKIDECLQEICLIEVMSTTLIICLLEYYCMKEWLNNEPLGFVTYLILLVSYVFNVFIFCHIGERLQEQYEMVGTAAYMLDWHRLPDKLGLSLVMIISMASYPRKLTAGRMLDLSIRNFGAIMRTSITYLNMLRAMTT